MKIVNYELKAEGGLLIGRAEGKRVKEAICRQLEGLAPNTVLQLGFGRVAFVDVSCADEMVVKVLARLQAGEFPDRFLILSNIKAQHRENVETALEVAEKAVIVKELKNFSILGKLVNSYRQALEEVMRRGAITARELQQALKYSTVNEASTKLSYLYQQRLIAREPFRRPVRGGGRQFKYLSLLQGN